MRLRIASTRCSTSPGAEVARGTTAKVTAKKTNASTTPVLRRKFPEFSVVMTPPLGFDSLRRIFGLACVALQFPKEFHFALGVRRLPLLAIDSRKAKVRLSRKRGVFFQTQQMQPGFLRERVVPIKACGFA